MLQRDMNVNVWGWADPGEKVSVQSGGQSVSAIAGEKGKWSVTLAPVKANTTPQNLTLTARRTVADGKAISNPPSTSPPPNEDFRLFMI
jgi:sialate O-acetylesterase